MLCLWPEGKSCRESMWGFSSFPFYFFSLVVPQTQKFKDRCSIRLIHLILLVPQFKVSSVLSKRGLFTLRSIQIGSAGGGLLGFCSLGKRWKFALRSSVGLDHVPWVFPVVWLGWRCAGQMGGLWCTSPPPAHLWKAHPCSGAWCCLSQEAIEQQSLSYVRVLCWPVFLRLHRDKVVLLCLCWSMGFLALISSLWKKNTGNKFLFSANH